MASNAAVRQSTFAVGELSPRALGRTDSPAYKEGLAQLRNWIINPQGSISRRPGFKYLGACKTVSAFAATERSSGTGAYDLNDAVYAEELGMWVAVGDSNGTNPVIVCSVDDGVTWAAAGTIPTEDADLYAVAWSGSLFVAVGEYDGATNTTIMISSDGDTWTTESQAVTGTPHLRGVVWTATSFLAVGESSGIILRSTNGTVWTEEDAPGVDLWDIAIDPTSGVIIAVSDTTDSHRISTDDGDTWSALTGQGSQAVFYDDTSELFYIGTNLIYRGNGNGTWTTVQSSPGGAVIQAFARYGGILIAVFDTGGVYFYSLDDGGTWNNSANQISGATGSLNGARFGNGILVIVGDDDTSDADLFTIFEDTTGRRLIPFAGSTGAPYMMEFGHLYIRFWRNDSRVESSPGTPLEVTTPWSGGEIADLQWAQANDVMYLTHPNYATRKLTRTGEASFTLANMQDVSGLPTSYLLKDGPYQPENSTSLTITPSAATGSITLTASADLFESTDVGRAVRLFESPEWGWCVITAVTNATTATATVIGSDLADTSATARWALGAFSATSGYPSAVSFYQQRLVFAATDAEPQGHWASVVGSFEEFQPTQFDDTVVPDNGMAFTIATRRLSRVRWLAGARQLVSGMATGPFISQGSDENAAFSPLSLSVRLASEFDASAVLPVIVGDVVVYAQSGGLRVRGLAPNQGAFNQPDLTLLADHVTQTGIKEMAFAAVPSSVLWAVRADGKLIGLTVHPETQASGWHLHTLGGSLDGADEPRVLSIAVLPSEGFDQLFAIVRRTINGSTVEYVEAMQEPFDDTATGVDIEDAWHLDSAVKYDGPSTTAISGLDHLEGEAVQVWADGAAQADKTVSSGAITISSAASVVLVGYDVADSSPIQVAPVRFAEEPQAHITVHEVTLEVLETSALRIGPDSSTLYAVPLDSGLNTGDVERVTIPAASAATITRPQYAIYPTHGNPASLLSLVHHMEAELKPSG